MADNVTINIQQDNDIVNIVSSQVTEVIDINVAETTEEVTLNITEEIIQVNINKVTGGGGNQTLAETLALGNNTGGTDILLNNDDVIQLENNSSIRKGTYDFGQNGGVSRICGVDYEDMWQGGIRHVFDNNGFIRNSTNGFNLVPNYSFDISLRFKVGSIWTLDDGTSYICTDATVGAAVWELYNAIPTNTSDLTNDGEDGVNPFITAVDVPSQVNSDWNATSGVEEILNKPTIPTNTSDLTNDSNFVVDASYTHTDNNFTTTLKNKLDGISAGAEVNVNADWNATSGDAQILNKPTIPAAQVNSDWNATSGVAQILNKPSLTGFGDMLKSTYDTDNTGVVDNAEAIKIIGRNSTGSTLYRGTVIYISGSTGNRPNFVKAQANGESTSAGTFGVIADDLANNSDGYCIALGYLDNLDTRTTATHPFTADTLADGDTIYLSPTTAGYITNVKPSAPDHLVYIGKVTRTSPTNGTIVYRIQNGYELEELHNVAISSVADKQLLSYDSATSLWKNKSVTTSDIAASTNKNYVTDANLTTIGNQSGTNTGDETTATIKTKLGAVTTSTDGYLTSTNWNTFNTKLSGVHTLKTLASGQNTHLSISSTATASVAAIANRLTAIPYIPNVSFTCASLYINVNVLALASNCRILIYSDLNGVPNTKLYESADLSCATIGQKVATTAFSFIAGTTYWLCVHSSGIPTLSYYNVSQIIPVGISSTAVITSCYIINPTYGSAPTTFGTPTAGAGSAPFIGITF